MEQLISLEEETGFFLNCTYLSLYFVRSDGALSSSVVRVCLAFICSDVRETESSENEAEELRCSFLRKRKKEDNEKE